MINPFSAVGTFAGATRRLTRLKRPPVSFTERQAFFRRDFWVDYPVASALRMKLELMYFLEGQVRPEGLLITGPSNNGKTSAALKFMQDILAAHEPERDRPDIPPIVKAETPPSTPSPKGLYMTLLHAAGAPFSPTAHEQALANQVLQLFSEAGVRMLIIDEIHNGLVGSPNQQRALLNTLKSLSNSLQISVVLIGTEDARIMIGRDLQLESRFPSFEIPAWGLTDEYAQLIDDMITAMELAGPSPAEDFDFVAMVHSRSAGLTGATRRLIAEAACAAEANGSNSVDIDAIATGSPQFGG